MDRARRRESGRGDSQRLQVRIDVQQNSINLTLLKAALAPDMHADRGVQQFTYALYVYNGSFGDSGSSRKRTISMCRW